MYQSNHSDNVPEIGEADSKLLLLLNQVCEHGCDAIPALEAYLKLTLTDEELQECPLPEETFQKWQKEHPELFKNTSSRWHRWGYRLVVIAAAIITLNSLFTVVFGKSTVKYITEWREEAFRFWHVFGFQTSEDSKTIYYPDGSSENWKRFARL